MDKKLVPLIEYKDGKRIVIGLAIVHESGFVEAEIELEETQEAFTCNWAHPTFMPSDIRRGNSLKTFLRLQENWIGNVTIPLYKGPTLEELRR